jgi:uncharacterized membrane protein YfcA
MLWTVLNTILVLKWTAQGGVWNAEVTKAIGVAFPFLIAGIFAGDWMHHRVNERVFRLLVYAVLFLSGLAVFYELLK